MSHQVEGVEFLLARRSGLLAFEQGLGKTLVAIEAFGGLRAGGGGDARVVVCPNPLKQTGAGDLPPFARGRSVHLVGGGRSQRRRGLAPPRGPVVVIN